MVYNETLNQILAALPEGYSEILLGGALGAVFALLGIIAILLIIALYVYQAYAWMLIAERQKHKHPWLSWIPFAAGAMRLQLGGFHWAWIFLLLIPIIGWIALIVLLTISIWRIFEKEKYEAWLSLSYPLMFVPKLSGIGNIAYYIILGFVTWKKPGKKKKKK